MFLALCFGVLVLGLYSKSFGVLVLVLGLYSKSFEKFFIWESGLRRWANENDSHSVYVKLVATNHNSINHAMQYSAHSIFHAMQYGACIGFMFYVLCFMFYVLYLMFYVLCFMFYIL